MKNGSNWLERDLVCIPQIARSFFIAQIRRRKRRRSEKIKNEREGELGESKRGEGKGVKSAKPAVEFDLPEGRKKDGTGGR